MTFIYVIAHLITITIAEFLNYSMTKAELRKVYLEKRKEITPGQLSRFSEAICEIALSNFQLEEKTVSLFLPIERQKEINTYLIWEKGKNIGARIAVPKANFENNLLKHYLFENYDQLEVNSIGIPEPKKGKLIPVNQLDIVFVPLLVIDKQGHRVGYGKGFYDRFLHKCAPHCQFIGLNLFDPIDEITDVLPTDIRLHGLITPAKFIRFEH
jgi:5-formyltetrahydrofolate cyclo-ligase